MNVHGYEVPETALDAAREAMASGDEFDTRAISKVIARHFPFPKGQMSREGYLTVCLDAAHRLIRESRSDLEVVRRGFHAFKHSYRWRDRPQSKEPR
ncbi:hypothetical protein L7Q78_18365 [Achromobacter xylosoxidans]|uniref:hypothetical protein n=1 Tax=Alcaligenes xylosoxydans xylosoxydans TaxID=85698 RepID=UPI001F068443|nr:hypothetical protein [Achromobacter xylosoxidans]MCH1984828.1 hypothetical protein [Achromobacter xylosoxidans]MCH1994755.1 hypothetical protein [Achromobacter xylosoxidans]MCH4589497.1 hypothetical protein [Achromobacter xylosoxidans]